MQNPTNSQNYPNGNNNYIAMSSKAPINHKYWNESKQIFFTPKLSLEGHNLFPHISEIHAARDQPFLNILKKPIMSLYDRMQIRSEKKPVCIVGTPKEVQVRHVRTGNLKKNRQQKVESSFKKETLSTYTPYLIKTESEVVASSPSRQLMPISPPAPEEVHYYVLGPGNNIRTVEQVLWNRKGWLPTSSSIFHFRWQQARPKYQNLAAPHRQLLNHLPGHEVISDKANLLINLKSYCQKSEVSMYKIVPVSFIFDFASGDVQEEMKKFINFFIDCRSQPNPEKQDNQDTKKLKSTSRKRDLLCETVLDSPKKTIPKQNKTSPMKMLKKSSEINEGHRKKQQAKNLYKCLIGVLKPFYLFQDMSNPRKQSLWTTAENEDIYGQSSLWLLKPSDLNRGRGIKLFRTVQELSQLLRGQLQKNGEGSFIVQKYLEKPLLMEGRKFDIRMWILVTHNRETFMFQEGYIRLSSEVFSLDSSSLFTHLTNNAVQKHASNYGQYEQGNILPLSYLYNEGYIAKDDLYQQMKRYILLSIQAAGSKLYQPTEKNQSISVGTSAIKNLNSKVKYFEIFGYDFMIDCSKHMWLIEVNTNPCIELSNKWLSAIVPRMLDDAFKLTLDKLFVSKNKSRTEKSEYPVSGYQDEANMWELLIEETNQKSSCLF